MKTKFKSSVFVRGILCIHLSIFINISFAQLENPCGVKASFTPSNKDSIFLSRTTVHLQSTSINATSLEWLLDGFRLGPTSKDWYYDLTTGTHTISLVAKNGNCTDTATVFYFLPGTTHDINQMLTANYGQFNTFEYGTSIDDTPDDGYLLGGYGFTPSAMEYGYVIKLRDRGCIDWSRKFVNTGNRVSTVYAASDGTFYVNFGLYFLKLDNKGDLLWKKSYKLTGDDTPYRLGIIQITGDAYGNIYIISRGSQKGYLVLKLDPAGNQIWSRYFEFGANNNNDQYPIPWSIILSGDKIYTTGTIRNINTYFNFIHCIDAVDGKSNWQYGYTASGGPQAVVTFGQLSHYNNLLMTSGVHGTAQNITLIDDQGIVRKSIKAQYENNYSIINARAEADSKGNIFMMHWARLPMSLQPYFAYYTNFLKIDTFLNKHWGMTYSDYSRGYFADAALNKSGSLGAVGEDFGKVAEGSLGSRDFRFIKIDSVQSTVECNWRADNFTLSEVSIDRNDFQWSVDSTYTLFPVDVNLSVEEVFTKFRYTCPDFIDSCSFMKVRGPRTLCSLQDTYTYKIHRNKACALVPEWDLSKGIELINKTDSTITVKFSRFGTYKISALLNSCTKIKDSLTVTIASKTAPLNLGNDTVICANTSIKLNASRKFMSYQWQDNSTDSIYWVKTPGLYWVQVIDSCGNTIRDSIELGTPDNLFVDAGPDRIKCNSDTIRLNAPDGYISYTWSTSDSKNLANARSVIVNPLEDIPYFLRAEKTTGCFAYDTIQVKVYRSQIISLGHDTSFCHGGSIYLDAGPGFTQYQWSNGSTDRLIQVNTAGSYRISAVNSEGCWSYDTLTVVKIYPLPGVQLDRSSALCSNSSRTLDAGSFSSYLWQDGSSKRSFTLSDTGRYYVTVVDHHQCIGSDTVSITKILPLPKDFLRSDTAICSYGTLVLEPIRSFSAYHWSTGSITKSTNISKPGLYTLEVVNAEGCIGLDSILVQPKQCMSGLYVPSAFTPNNNGRNDTFKALLFGPIIKFEFRIYNRWGQVIFSTTDPTIGWNGKFKGLDLDAGVYVWTCYYQLDSDQVKAEKGTVVLIR